MPLTKRLASVAMLATLPTSQSKSLKSEVESLKHVAQRFEGQGESSEWNKFLDHQDFDAIDWAPFDDVKMEAHLGLPRGQWWLGLRGQLQRRHRMQQRRHWHRCLSSCLVRVSTPQDCSLIWCHNQMQQYLQIGSTGSCSCVLGTTAHGVRVSKLLAMQ